MVKVPRDVITTCVCGHSNMMHTSTGLCTDGYTSWLPRNDCSYPFVQCTCKEFKEKVFT